MQPPAISPFVLRFFRFIVRGYFRRNFHAVRITDPAPLAQAAGPLIVYSNHSSWWDPMVLVLLAARFLPGRSHFAPMDAAALARYGILRRIGIFPVDLHTARGGAQFLRTGLAVLASGGVLWITPQGRFADPREAELNFKPGLAALAARVPGGCTLLPLAIEYPFWNERLPETLLHLGAPVRVEPGTSAAEAETQLRDALGAAMLNLREKAMAREPALFQTLSSGRLGTGGFYSLGQRLAARVRGRRYQPEHTPDSPREAA